MKKFTIILLMFTAIISALILLSSTGLIFISGEEQNKETNSVNLESIVSKDIEPDLEEMEQTVIEDPQHPVSLPALMEKEFNGRDLKQGNVLSENSVYTRYYIEYMSGDLKISGIMNVPKGEGTWPVLILNHGYIDPRIYTNGRGLKREQDYLARRGYIVIHPDYRGHASSDPDPNTELNFRFGYTEDVINAIMAVKNSDLEIFQKNNIGMLGHSMGGGIALNVMVVDPDLIKAVVLFAPVNALAKYNFDRWTREREEVAEEIINTYGEPDASPEFWASLSPATFFDRVEVPVQLHHGTLDKDVPLLWSEELELWLTEADKDLTFYVYENEPHEFINAWPRVMERTVEFFDQHVKQ